MQLPMQQEELATADQALAAGHKAESARMQAVANQQSLVTGREAELARLLADTQAQAKAVRP